MILNLLPLETLLPLEFMDSWLVRSFQNVWTQVPKDRSSTVPSDPVYDVSYPLHWII